MNNQQPTQSPQTNNAQQQVNLFPPNRWIIDPADVRKIDEQRVRAWCLQTMSKHEHRFTSDVQNKRIVYKGEVKAEEIDIRNIYPFPNLHWFIHKQVIRGRDGWFITLLSGHKLLFRLGPYIKV